MENIVNYGITIEHNGDKCIVTSSPNATLHVDIETILIEQPRILRSGQKFSLRANNVAYKNVKALRLDLRNPVNTVEFRHLRNVNPVDVKTINGESFTPGFKFNWYYSGVEVKDDKRYSNKAFVRNISKY